jgi:hypothetical protein
MHHIDVSAAVETEIFLEDGKQSGLWLYGQHPARGSDQV